ncbi:TRAP transporter permease [Azospirillum halopraeferens]|uniref:TRAP transporter permease n=1 Tax=Azospirillum halopraeferens TaxID=34010 RepID=UPI0004124537|nr:TRAP transporter permease [Azospirillum halopraeferens]
MTSPARPPDGAAATRRVVDRENPATAHLDLPAWTRRVIFALSVAFALFQLWTATFAPLSSAVVRAIHVGFLLALTFLLFGAGRRHERTAVPALDWILAALALAVSLYHLVFEHDLLLRAGDPTALDLAVGTVTIVLVFEAARRILGPALPIICGVFLPYALLGPMLPDALAHRGYGFDQVVEQLAFGTEGIYGTPIYVSATFIFLFILFGAFLERAGMIRLFNDVALGMFGHAKGGPAKVAVVSSGFMGTINGSGVANVLTTGQFTIPLMTRFGYRPAFAGAVEATASMGGQLMPPIMGAAAFIMAETIGVPYHEVALAALLPAVLYFGAAFWMVHLEAGLHGLNGVPKAECPSALAAIRAKWHLIFPLVVLVALLFSGFTPMFAGVIGIACTIVLILGTGTAGTLPAVWLRTAFWIGLGLVAAGLWRMGLRVEHLAVAMVGLLVLPSLALRGGRETLTLLVRSLADGARNAIGVGVACALVGVLIGILTLTGLASGIAAGIVEISGGSLMLALVLTMVASIVLGTGLPTTANYIITSAIAAPALLEMGVPLIVSHMFVFYFGIMADLTPPVALAALAASSVARGASHLQIGWIATRIAIAGYVVPFMAVYAPALLLQTDDPVAVVYIAAKAAIGIMLWGGASVGYFLTRLSWPERAFATAAAALLVVAMPITDEIGLGMAAAFTGWQWWRTRRAAVRVPAV